MHRLSLECLKECLDYAEETGIFTWKDRPLTHFKSTRGWKIYNTNFKGKVAGSFDKSTGYITIRLNGNKYAAHQLAYFYMTGERISCDIDHKDGVRTNNKWNNLRKATRAQNLQNRKKISDKSITGQLGVSFHKASGKYRARITANYKEIYLGLYDTIEQATLAYLKAKEKYHSFS